MIVEVNSINIDVDILHFDSPFSFFCRVPSKGRVIADEISTSIESIFSENTPKTRDASCLQYGELCAVKYNAFWARAFCMESENVWLPDHGETLPICDYKFYKLPKNIADIPSDVFHCALGKITPLKVVWDASHSRLTSEASEKWETHALNFVRTLIFKSSATQLKPRKITRVISSNNLMILGDVILDVDTQQLSLTKELIKKSYALKDVKYDYCEKLFPYRCVYDSNESRQMKVFDKLITEDVAFKIDFAPRPEIINPKILSIKDKQNLAGVVQTAHDGTIYNVLDAVNNIIFKHNICKAYENYDQKCIGRGCKRIVDSKNVIVNNTEPENLIVYTLPGNEEDSWSD